jgi:hypothetical protein
MLAHDVELTGDGGGKAPALAQTLCGVLDIDGGQITAIRSVVNPDKLTHLGPVGDLASIVRPTT